MSWEEHAEVSHDDVLSHRARADFTLVFVDVKDQREKEEEEDDEEEEAVELRMRASIVSSIVAVLVPCQRVTQSTEMETDVEYPFHWNSTQEQQQNCFCRCWTSSYYPSEDIEDKHREEIIFENL